MVSQTGCCLLGLCLLPLLLAPAAAQAVAPVALPPLSAIEGGSATVASQMDLPATVQELCANVSLPAAAAPNGFTQASVGPLQRLNTTTASWGYHRCGAGGREGGRGRGAAASPLGSARSVLAAAPRPAPRPALATRRRPARRW